MVLSAEHTPAVPVRRALLSVSDKAGLLEFAQALHAAGVLRTAPLGALDGNDGALMWQLHVDAATRLANVPLPEAVGPSMQMTGMSWVLACATENRASK